MTLIRIRKVGTLDDLPAEQGKFQRGTREVNRGPEASFRVADGAGTFQGIVQIGNEIDIQEGQDTMSMVRQFPGIVFKRKRTRGVDGHFLEVTLRHKEYHKLRGATCDRYTYDEDGKPATDRDNVTVNPWWWRIFRSPFGNVLDVDGNTPFVDGVPLEEAVKGLLGTRLVFTHRFQDGRLLRPSDVVGTPGSQIQVFSDNYDQAEVASLQRVRGPSGYVTNSSFIRLVPIESGDPNVSPMGNLVNVTLHFFGRPDGAGNAPVVEVTRRGRDGAPTWEAVPLTPTGNYNGSGLTRWMGTRVFTGPAGASLGVRIRIAGAGTTETTRVYFMRVGADLATTDTGLTAGTIETYVDPHGQTGAALCVDEDYAGLTRADALERVRQATLTDPAVSQDPQWALYVADNGQLHFKQRRGADLGYTYQLADGTLQVLEHEEYAEFAAYQVIAEGGGTGDEQYVISDKTAYSAGGLYDATRDPAGGALYGNLPTVLIYRDQGCTSRTELRRRARCQLRTYLDPRPFYKLRFPALGTRPFDVGDAVTVQDTTLGINTLLQTSGVTVAWDASQGHTWDVDLGTTLADPKQGLAGSAIQQRVNLKAPILAAGTKPAGGPGVYFDATHYGRGVFTVPEGVEVDRVLLTLRTLPWQIYARGGLSATHTHPVGDVTVGGGGSGGNAGEEPFGLNIGGSATAENPAPGRSNFGSVFAPSPSASAVLDYVDVFGVFFNTSGDLRHFDPVLEIKRTNGAFSGQVLATTNYGGSIMESNTPQTGDDTVGMYVRFVMLPGANRTILPTDTFQLTVNPTDHSGNGPYTVDGAFFLEFVYEHKHTVSIGASGAHVHPHDFGIWQFDGDAGTGDGVPVYGSGVRFAIDPGLDVNGDPSNFTLDRHPRALGDPAASVKVQMDVTPYLRQTADGRVAPGQHEVIFLAGTSGSNSKGLAVVSMTADVRAAEATG